MKLNQDKVPATLEEAVSILKEGSPHEDIAEIRTPNFELSKVHSSVGKMLRNEWTLWDSKTILIKWFKQNYGIEHADDVSSLILDCFFKDVRGEPRKDKELAQSFIEHWKKQKKSK